MVGFRPSVGLAYTGEYCATQAQRVGIARLLRGVIPGNIGAMVRAINSTTALLCDELDDITEDDLAPVPFEGGQCDGVRYFARGDIQSTDCASGNVTVNGPFDIRLGFGPMSLRELVDANGNTTRTIVDRNGVGGTNVTELGTCNETTGSVSNRLINITMQPLDGATDDCGNPPRQFPTPLEPLPLPPIDFTWEDNNGVTINATANITLAPAISIDGSISFPTTIVVGALLFNGNFNLDGSFTFSPTVNINPPGSPPSVGPPLPGEEPAPPDETRSVLAGVAIVVQGRGRRLTELDAIGAPDILIPRAASVNFLVEVDGDQYWSSDYDAKNANCFVACPPDVVCLDAAVTPYQGVQLTWQRVYREERIPPEA